MGFCRSDHAGGRVSQRLRCGRCLQPEFSCYCGWLKPFDPGFEIIILIHPKEFRRRIATGRMAHLMLENSKLFCGHDFTSHGPLNALLQDATRMCVMLYPGAQSVNLSRLSPEQRFEVEPAGRRLSLLVIDGTWATARKMVNLSHNLQALPRVCFTPPTPSNFRIRRQPRAECYSTIEAIHHTIDLLRPFADRRHDRLLEIFERMVDRQLELAHALRV